MLSPEVDAVITARGRAVCCAEIKMRAEKRDMKVLESHLDCDRFVVDARGVKRLFR